MPRNSQEKALQEARDSFRSDSYIHSDPSQPLVLTEEDLTVKLKHAESRLSFLRMTTPSIGRFKPQVCIDHFENHCPHIFSTLLHRRISLLILPCMYVYVQMFMRRQ